MSAAAPAVAFGVFFLGLLAWRSVGAAAVPGSSLMAMVPPRDDPMPYTPQDLGLSDYQVPPPVNGQADRNLAAFLLMIRAAEGTAGEGGYGALFGWPAAGRSFDPYSVTGHPRIFFKYTNKAGKELNVSPAGAYQIVWTTWNDRRAAFLTWAAKNGLSTVGFLPATQDAFAIFLLHVRGALEDVKAGRFYAALGKVRVEWASLPGANVDQPMRSDSYVLAAYTNAGGVIA